MDAVGWIGSLTDTASFIQDYTWNTPPAMDYMEGTTIGGDNQGALLLGGKGVCDDLVLPAAPDCADVRSSL